MDRLDVFRICGACFANMGIQNVLQSIRSFASAVDTLLLPSAVRYRHSCPTDVMAGCLRVVHAVFTIELANWSSLFPSFLSNATIPAIYRQPNFQV